MLCRYINDKFYVLELDKVHVDENLIYKEELSAISDSQVRKLRTIKIASVKVLWKNRLIEKATWNTESYVQSKISQLFENSSTILNCSSMSVYLKCR